MPKISPARFIREIRAEGAKIHWPSRKETVMSTIMVFIMASVAALFFLLIDQILKYGVEWLIAP